MENIPLSGTIIDFWKDIAYGEGGERSLPHGDGILVGAKNIRVHGIWPPYFQGLILIDLDPSLKHWHQPSRYP